VQFGQKTIINDPNVENVRDSSPGGFGKFFYSLETLFGEEKTFLTALRYWYAGTGPFTEWGVIKFCFANGQVLDTGPLEPQGTEADSTVAFSAPLGYVRWEIIGISELTQLTTGPVPAPSG
jgi:hypothetical protein